MSDIEQAKAHFFAALDHLDRKDYAAAEMRLRAALAIVPDRVSALVNLAGALFRQEKLREAAEVARRAVTLAPEDAEGWLVLGTSLCKAGRIDEALAAMENGVAAAPGSVSLLMGRASVFRMANRFDHAVADLEAARRINPEEEDLLGLLVGARLYACDWTGLDAEIADLLAGVRAGRSHVDPFTLLATPATPADQLACAHAISARDYPAMPPIWRGERYAHEPIRIAYVSGDYRTHPLTSLMAGVFEHHDRARVETFGFSYGPDDGSAMRTRVAKAFDHFLDVREQSDGDIAAMIRDREIDVAVDLGGFTTGGRPRIFAARPAPVQASYLGYPGTSGSPVIDYIVADATVIPPEARGDFSEKVVRLPDTYYPNGNTNPIAETPTRAAAGLPPTGFVFCSFNQNYKITPAVFDIWMDLLKALPDSVLWLLQGNDAAPGNLRREAETRGVAGERIVFAPRVPVPEHLGRHRLAGLFLDTAPYNAHTTATDALWAGLPVLTCPGSTFASRVAASVLGAVGLPELVTSSWDAYRDLALALARDPARLAAIRTRLAANRTTTALFDTARFTRHLEAAFVEMASRQRRGEAPEAFAVAPMD